MLHARFGWLFTMLLALAPLSCGTADGANAELEKTASARQAEAWSPLDDPSRFIASLERNLERLPTQGQAARIPWAGPYWVTYRDSINFRWDGPNTDSAAMKYEKAFAVPGVEDAVSRQFGVDSCATCKACTTDADCNFAPRQTCAIRNGKTEGRCIPNWWGLCHAWAPVSVMWPEPLHRVVRNGVTFHIQDLKALATLVHNTVTNRFVSLRCNLDSYSNMDFDRDGRPEPQQCRDTNPGSYHILLTHYLGLMRQTFVQDRTFDLEVYNAPVRAFRVLETRAVNAQEANALVSPDASDNAATYRFNPNATRFVYFKTEVSHIGESGAETNHNFSAVIDEYTFKTTYEYVLELDAAGTIVGGEWAGESKRLHPDFVWLPLGPDRQSEAEEKISYAAVKSLYDESLIPDPNAGD